MTAGTGEREKSRGLRVTIWRHPAFCDEAATTALGVPECCSLGDSDWTATNKKVVSYLRVRVHRFTIINNLVLNLLVKFAIDRTVKSLIK